MKCPLHPGHFTDGTECPRCAAERLTVIVCEIDKVDRTVDTLREQGHEPHFTRSWAVLVFDR